MAKLYYKPTFMIYKNIITRSKNSDTTKRTSVTSLRCPQKKSKSSQENKKDLSPFYHKEYFW